MPRGKKNKGNSGPAPPSNNNKTKSPAEPKVPDTVLQLPPDALLVVPEKSNDELKVRLANAKERLNLLQEVIGGIGDPTDVENFKASGIDAAKEKLNIIQDSVNSVKTTLLEVRQDAARSVTPEGSVGGTSKRRKNKKQHNQNPPQGSVAQPPAVAVGEKKLETDGAGKESITPEPEDGTSTISKKKRNRNKKKNAQQEQSQNSAPESLPQASNVVPTLLESDTIKINEPKAEVKENSSGGKSKNNKKNKKKGQQQAADDLKVESSVDVEAKDISSDTIKTPQAEVKPDNQANQNEKNKNNKKKGEGNNKNAQKANILETKEELTGDQKNISKIEADTSNNARKNDDTVESGTDVSDNKQASQLQKQNEKKSGKMNANSKDQSNKAKQSQNKGQSADEKPVAKAENVLLTEVPMKAEDQLKLENPLSPVVSDEPNLKSEPAKCDPPKNKKDKRKGQATEPKVEEKPKEKEEKPLAQAPPSEQLNKEIPPKNETKDIDVDSLKAETPKTQEGINESQTPATVQPTVALSVAPLDNKETKETTLGKVIDVSNTPITAEKINERKTNKNEASCPQSHKNTKNKHIAEPQKLDKPEETLKVELAKDVPKGGNQAQCQVTEVLKDENKNDKDIKETLNIASAAVIVPTLPEKQKEEILQVTLSAVAVDTEAILGNNKKSESLNPILIVAEETIKSKIETTFAADNTLSLSKLDFSQVVKENKDKIPLMEIKALPVLCPHTEVVETKGTTDSAITNPAVKTIAEVPNTTKPIIDTAITTTEAKSEPIATLTSKPAEDTQPKPSGDETTKSKTDITTKPKSDTTPKPKADNTSKAETHSKSKTDSTSKAIVKPTDGATKPSEDGTAKPTADATTKPKDAQPKPPASTLPMAAVDTQSKQAADFKTKASSDDLHAPTAQETLGVEVSASQKQNKAKTPERKGNQKNEPKKPQQGKGQPVKQKQDDQKSQNLKKEEVKEKEKSLATAVPSTEIKPKEETTKRNENKEAEQVQQAIGEEKLEVKSAEALIIPKDVAKGKQQTLESVKSTETQQPLIEDKSSNKKSVENIVDPVQSKPGGPQIKDTKSLSSTSQKSPSHQQPEQQKQEHKMETSKKDQKKQNKKGKAPQPPDIPMDMSLLSASMIDSPTVVADEIILHEESEDQSSLIASDSKNVQGSDFVQSADSSLNKANADETKSLGAISMAPKNENKVTEIVRAEKNASPTSNKRNKEVANLKESVEMQEAKTQELPEKSAQQKLDPVQFPPVKLMDILEAKMTSPSVKPGNIAGNVRKLPKDAKRADQLNVQQQKARSKSPKENMAEKYVKNQKLATGDSKKQSAQNLKKDILNNEGRSIVTPVSKEKEVKEATKIDANLNATENKFGTSPIVTETEQVENLKESDVHIKQKADSLPENVTTPDKMLQKSKDGNSAKIDKAVADDTVNVKPVIAPKPDLSAKPSPKTEDRSKKSPAKSCESKTPRKETTAQSKPTPQSKTPAQSKSPATSKSSAQPKSPPQPKSPSSTALTTSTNTPKTNDPQCTNAKKPEVPPKPVLPPPSQNKVAPISSPEEEEEFVEYKFTPRPVFISTACQICKVPLDTPNPCKFCQMISYCSDEHQREDQMSHAPLCTAIQEIAKKRGGHIYNNARILNDDDYRSLRVHTLNLCENFLKRHLLPFEREILLFPRLCCTGTCREWRQQSLIECKQCGQVSYCSAHPEHLSEQHEKWCNSFNLYQKIVLRQKNFGRIEPSLPSKIMLKPFDLSDNIDNVFKILYKNYGAIKDECIYATLTQLATAPLTALYAAQKNQQVIGEVYTIHLVGAELQFEADTLDKWETFFLHLVPTLVEFRVVFVGPELNAENLPLEILSRIRMCRTCRQNCRIVKFDFQCGILYHDYVNSSAFTKPDLVCFFNPGLYRTTGFNGLDTWPNTIKSATSMNCPIVVTSYTSYESPRDLERIQKESERPLSIVQSPHINPFASQRPERNFISDEIAPMIFKNYFCFCVK